MSVILIVSETRVAQEELRANVALSLHGKTFE